MEELGGRGALPPRLRQRRPSRPHPLEERATLPAPPWEREMDGDAASREREREKGERGGGGGPSREGREGRREGRVRAGVGVGQGQGWRERGVWQQGWKRK